MTAIHSDGSFVCTPNPTGVQPLSCAAGSAVTAIAANGVASCTTDPTPSVLVGGGLVGNGTTQAPISVDPTKVQVRVSGTCSVGSAIIAINADGSVVCGSAVPNAGVCPQAYVQDTTVTAFTVCTKALAPTQVDQVVRVGDFWIDRFEASSCGGSLGSLTGQDTTAVACSISGVSPTGGISQLQALTMCANAGKHLCRNEEWQSAVAGTLDPPLPSDGTGGTCVTQAGGARVTGGGTNCRSRFGAEDMIGNMGEWVADWLTAGLTWQTTDSQSTTPWPSGFGSDTTWNVNGRTWSGTNEPNGLPAAPVRGGNYGDGTGAGAFMVSLTAAPSSWYASDGARCCMSH